MLTTAVRPLTVDDYRELPEGPPYYQLIEGDLHMASSPDLFHQDILLNIAVLVRSYLDRHPIGSVHIAPSDVHLSELNVYQPDLYFVSKARKAILSKQGLEGAPDLVVEILSAKTSRFDKGIKREVYARSDVQELWIVDPESREILIYHLRKSSSLPARICNSTEKFESISLPGLIIPVEKVFKQ
jgi:Uma2 family endonuclease